MTNKISLNEKEVRKVHTVDSAGFVFFWRGRVFRAINKDAVEHVKTLLSCGLIEKLVNKELFPRTTITKDVSLEGFDLILEHQKIPYVSLPHEWSFNMLKDVCLAYLEVMKICKEYGYTLKDGHLYNFTFYNNRPIHFDLGSITDIRNGDGLSEYYASAIVPLKMWSEGDFYLANLILRDDHSHTRFLPSIPLTDHKTLSGIISVGEKRVPRFIRKAINYLGRSYLKSNILPSSSLSIEKLIGEVATIKKMPVKTMWSNYYGRPLDQIEIKSDARFNRLVSVINSLKLHSMIDLAGNNGLFSLLVSQKTKIERIFCTDYDEMAIDDLYLFLKKNNNEKISPLVLNFTVPIPNSTNQCPRADIAVALAVTHHLLLTQSRTIDMVLSMVGNYSTRFVLIEFMPLGLWNGRRAPKTPDWYTTESFRAKFKEQFTLLLEEQTEPNRIFFLGEKK